MDTAPLAYEHLRDYRRWTLSEVLTAQAAVHGPKTLVRTTDGECLSYAEAADEAARVAAYLEHLGVRSGDTLAVLLPNSLDFVRVWLATGYLGATLVPLNHALTGGFLAHQLRMSEASVVLCHDDYVGGVRAVLDEVPKLNMMIVAGGEGDPDAGRLTGHRLDRWATRAPRAAAETSSRDIACVMFTSGTTGPSKAVEMPQTHCYLFGLGVVDNLALTANDCYYIVLPLYHANALFMQLYATLIAGASAVLRTRFSASAFIDDIREHGCTITNVLGAVAQFVIDQPPTAGDRDHRLRAVMPAPNPPHHEEAWRNRFGVSEVVSGYGMTECNIPLYGLLGESKPGTAGYAYESYFEVELHDLETDAVVAPGELGEICVRSNVPHGFCTGYRSMPEESLVALRNFWFHTGDLAVMDDDGCVTFVDRGKDCIRRRGENISSFEVEFAIGGHEGIAEVAAFAVPASHAGTEDEVMLAVVPADPSLTPAQVARYADDVLPAFARPRYIELVPELPKTPTERVQKATLRDRGVTKTTWDRDLSDGENRTPCFPHNGTPNGRNDNE